MLLKAILILASLAALALGLQAPRPGYGVQDFTWKVQAFANGTKVNITGTIQNVIAELTKINPDFPRNNISIPNLATADYPPPPQCYSQGVNDWGAAYVQHIQEGIRYLRTVTTTPVLGPGPHSCGRVSCTFNSAIWLCNEDTTRTISLPNFDIVADYAQAIIDNCKYWDLFLGAMALGEVVDPDNWHVDVHSDKC